MQIGICSARPCVLASRGECALCGELEARYARRALRALVGARSAPPPRTLRASGWLRPAPPLRSLRSRSGFALPPVGAAARSNKISVLYGRYAARGDCARGVRCCALRPRAAACDHKPLARDARAGSGYKTVILYGRSPFLRLQQARWRALPRVAVQSYPPR